MQIEKILLLFISAFSNKSYLLFSNIFVVEYANDKIFIMFYLMSPHFNLKQAEQLSFNNHKRKTTKEKGEYINIYRT